MAKAENILVSVLVLVSVIASLSSITGIGI